MLRLLNASQSFNGANDTGVTHFPIIASVALREGRKDPIYQCRSCIELSHRLQMRKMALVDSVPVQ
jgi:hypothetical protein